ncbi:MAG: hypothetical protein AB1806_16225 [Acidobacteriota bacterium]
MVDTVLVIVTIISLTFAAAMGVIVWRVLRLEQKRSAARVAALSAAASEWQDEGWDSPDVRRDPAVALWSDLVIERTAGLSGREGDDRLAAAHLFRTDGMAEGNGRRLVAGLALAATGLVIVGALVVSVSTRGGNADAAQAVPPPLELLSLEHARAGGQLAVRGVVRNPMARGEVRDLVAVLFLFDGAGRYLGTLKQPVVTSVVSPGANSPFEFSISDRLPVGRYRLTFHAGGTPVPHLDCRTATPDQRPNPESTPAPRRTAALAATAAR